MTLLSRQRPPSGASAPQGPMARVVKPSARFGVHVLGMCLVMCVSLALFSMAAAGASSVFGVADLEQRFPQLSAMVVAVMFALVMVAWMRLMRMEWRPTVEMSGAALFAGFLMVTGNQVGLVPAGELVGAVCGVACAAMIVIMLFRFRLYAGHSRHAHRAAGTR
jgi:magnesium-transporting ATPase (P-type)